MISNPLGDLSNENGSVVWVSLTVSPTWKPGELPEYHIEVVQDITERKKAEEERRKLERQILQATKMETVGRLAGGVAHDFNNLLTIILGCSELLLQRSGLAHPSREKLDQIAEAARRAAEPTQQLLAFSRKQLSRPTVLSLNAVVNATHKLLIRVIGEDIRITTRLGAESGLIKADRGQIEQVLMKIFVFPIHQAERTRRPIHGSLQGTT